MSNLDGRNTMNSIVGSILFMTIMYSVIAVMVMIMTYHAARTKLFFDCRYGWLMMTGMFVTMTVLCFATADWHSDQSCISTTLVSSWLVANSALSLVGGFAGILAGPLAQQTAPVPNASS